MSEAPAPASGLSRLRAAVGAARHCGVAVEAGEYRSRPGEAVPSAASLVAWLRERGLSARASRASWRQLLRLGAQGAQGSGGAPAVLLLRGGGAAVLAGADARKGVVWLRDPERGPAGAAEAVDELRLSRAWGGEVLLVGRARDGAVEDEPFSLAWLLRLVGRERGLLRDVGLASVTLSALTVVPPLLVMSVVDRVVVHRSLNTLALLAAVLLIATLYETVLGYARRELVQVVSTRVDAQLNLHVFRRLLALPLDYFERHQAGQINYKVGQIWKVREFLTGKLMGTFLDLITLAFLLPFLFWMHSTLAWMVLAGSLLIAGVIAAFLPALRRVMGRLNAAEAVKGSVMVETVHGIRTVKSLAIEPQRQAEWDERAAAAGALRLRAGRLANWPQTLIAPVEGFIQRGVLLVGAYLALSDDTGLAVGGLLAFMMLGGRVAQPLVGLAKLVEDFEDVRASIAEVASVLNNPVEARSAGTGGLRPRFEGAIAFDGVTFSYPGAPTPALEAVSFSVPAGTTLGVVGRSGSGKSTITRLLQGINRDYSGFVKLDGAELREVELSHLRRSFGVVLQDNFLFRGTVRDNIAAGRAGITLEDVVRAARLAGAEEFIERLPQGYETPIEEGSANLSGGQRQRLAIARAVVADPKLLILDEATSALDPESEAVVNANLARLGRGRTMVVVSHRLSSLVECDRILVLDRGRVVDCAPHRVLLERCGVYRALWAQQNRHAQGGSGAGPGASGAGASAPPSPTPLVSLRAGGG